MDTMSDLGRGVKLGETGWEAKLEANQALLLDNWINRDDFAATYGQKSNADFINALIVTAGLRWPAGKRTDLLQALDDGKLSRASVLSEVIADKDFCAREYNTAYVLMHFFGYLRRNPDDPPDSDLRGLIFWRARLDSWHDYRAISRAFLESSEYRASPLPQ